MSAQGNLGRQFKTPQEWHDHMVDEHGHDSIEDNPGLKSWSMTDWQEQHDEDHEFDDHDHEH